MNIRVGILFLLAGCVLDGIAGQQAKPRSPAAQYAALLKEYNTAAGGIRTAKTDEQRRLHVERLGKFPARFLTLAETHPKDAISLKAIRQAIQAMGSTDSAAQIAWETNPTNLSRGITDNSPSRVMTILLRDHLRSDQIGPVIDRIRYGYRMEFEKFLRAVQQKNPHREMRALACLARARFLNDRLSMLQLATDRPRLVEFSNKVLGEKYLPELKQRNRDGLAKEIEVLFEQAEKFADVKAARGGTVAAHAKMELHGIRHLSIGKTAPDITGRDQDGRAFKLSDYRGKVVLLYFWMEY